jgi:hypothetical protein
MKRFAFCFAVMLAVLTFAQSTSAGTVHGTVNNGTTGKPGVGVDVVLIQLQGGMQPVANTKTDSSGNFAFDNPSIGGQPMLIRAVYKGVNFHQPLPPGKDSISVEVFEPTSDAKTISVPSHVVIFQPNGASLIVGEEYGVKNDSKPPQAFFKVDGNFEVALPDNAELKQIAASGPSGMPVVQAPIDKGKNKYAVSFAFRPGESEVRLSYELPYPNNKMAVKLPTVYGGGRLIVVAPPSVTLSADGLQMAGQEQGMNIYERASVATGTTITVNLSGTAPPPAAANGPDAGGAPGRAENVQGGEAPSAAIQSIPGRLDEFKWWLLGGFCVLFFFTAVLLWKKPISVTVAGPDLHAQQSTQKRQAAHDNVAKSAEASSSHNGNSLASLDHATANSLDVLKDQLFRLELRRQAGTISDEEYSRERTKAEQVLRDLVRG